MNKWENNGTGRKAGTISTRSPVKALAAVYLCFCHEHHDMNLNNKPKPAVRPPPAPHSQVSDPLVNERSKSALHHSNIPLPKLPAVPFRVSAHSALLGDCQSCVVLATWQRRDQAKGLQQYSAGCLQETFVFEVLELPWGVETLVIKLSLWRQRDHPWCVRAQLTVQPGEEKGCSSTRNESFPRTL